MLLLINNSSDLFIPDLYSDEDDNEDRKVDDGSDDEDTDKLNAGTFSEQSTGKKEREAMRHNSSITFKPIPAKLPDDEEDCEEHHYHKSIVAANCGMSIDGDLEDLMVEGIHMLIEYGIDINHTDKKGKSILHYAVEHASYWITYVLLTYCPNTSLTMPSVGTALLYAIQEHDLPKVQLLITTGGCEINRIRLHTDPLLAHMYTTALLYAIKCGFACIVTYLVDYVPSVDINARDFHQSTALIEAVKTEEEGLVEHMIVNRGAKVSLVDEVSLLLLRYYTTLMNAIMVLLGRKGCIGLRKN